jgi:CMP-N,N'-diacetyllegionaminic acid synthase
MKVLGIIPARGGSKGIPGKNIKVINGKPLIAYSIESAVKSKLITRTIVSTDNENIAEVAKEYGAEVPFVRPSEFATDKALTIEVIKHALNFFEKLGEDFDVVVLLQPTCPLRAVEDIDKAIKLISSSGCDSVVSLVNVGANHPARMYSLIGDKPKSVMDETTTMMPRQDLPPIYIRSGDIYAAKVNKLLKENSIMCGDIRAIIIAEDRTINIDTTEDLFLAEHKIKKLCL